MHRVKRNTCLLSLAVLIFCSYFPGVTAFAVSEKASLNNLYIEIGDALMNAKDEDWDSVKDNVTAFQHLWNKIKNANEKAAKSVTKDLNKVKDVMRNSEKEAAHVRELLSNLSKSLAAYDEKLNPVKSKQEKEKIKQLLPIIDQIQTDVKTENFDQAYDAYQQLVTKWTDNELIVRNQSVVSYGEIETQMAFIRIGISQDPPDKQKALTAINDLRKAINKFLEGNVTKQTTGSKYTLEDAVQLLEKSTQAMASNTPEKASENLNQLLLIWPAVEGEVRTKEPSLYSDIENKVPKAISMLNSKNKEMEKAGAIISNLAERLKLISSKTEYTFVDAMLILLREGLEAILVIAGLLAFLKKTNNQTKRGWIWGGAVAGLFASAALAVCINLFFSRITAATSREYLEGIIGIVAVMMMLTVGAWLHKKTNINHWNHYIERNLSKALAKGSLFSMATLSFLAIFREGAETIIFYAGMAPSMALGQLLLGIGIAFVLLLILGFVIIRCSAKIPLRPFFFVATWVIYILAFKMLGVSMHALQVANTVPTHYLNQVPFIEFIGLYPTIETLIPQAILLIVILGTSIYVKKSATALKTAASN